MSLDPAKLKPMVENVSRAVSSQFPSYVTADDTAQALYLWLLEKKTSVSKAVADSPDDWERKIASTMRKVAFDYCAKEKAAAEGYSTDDLYRYSIPKIKSLLPDVFDYQNWQSFGQHGDGQPRARAQANMTGDRMVELIDVKAALERLPDDTQSLLYCQYFCHYTMENLADEFDVSLEAAKKRAQRAVGAIQKELGRREPGEQPSPADRRVVRSNAAARAALASQYDG